MKFISISTLIGLCAVAATFILTAAHDDIDAYLGSLDSSASAESNRRLRGMKKNGENPDKKKHPNKPMMMMKPGKKPPSSCSVFKFDVDLEGAVEIPFDVTTGRATLAANFLSNGVVKGLLMVEFSIIQIPSKNLNNIITAAMEFVGPPGSSGGSSAVVPSRLSFAGSGLGDKNNNYYLLSVSGGLGKLQCATGSLALEAGPFEEGAKFTPMFLRLCTSQPGKACEVATEFNDLVTPNKQWKR